MRLIINASGTRATGVTQVTVSFIRECIKHPENQYFVFISKTVESQLNQSEFTKNFSFYVFDYKPFFNLKGIKTWRKLIRLEKDIRPDCVFTVFGPSVWQPNAPHLMGYAYPYYIYPESPFFKIISNKKRFIFALHKIFHKFYLERNGKFYVCETEDVTSRLPNYLKCNPMNLYTVTNSCNDYFNDFIPRTVNILPKKKYNEFRFITLSSFMTHKNLTILNEIIPILRKRLSSVDIRFILTVDPKLLNERLNPDILSQIHNLGRIPISDCPQVYYESDAMFLPSLMECFSASYAEAMKMRKPIATSNLPFATVVCGNSAIYFDPMNPEDIAQELIRLITEPDLQKKLVENGIKRLETFDTATSRAQKYLDICRTIA